jgi:uncharacterized lipoprotein
MRFSLQACIAISVVLLMASCAQLSPQQVDFAPTIRADRLIQGQGTVSLEVTDTRPDTTIGMRGGVYAQSATITAQAPLRELIDSLAKQVLAKVGMTITTSLPDTRIEITLDQLTYAVTPQRASIKRSTATATISVKVERGNVTYVKNHTTSQYIDTVGYASEEKNSALLNEVFDTVLENLFTDAGLETFLTN